MRKCRDCGEQKSVEQFVKNHVFRDGVDTICLVCNRRRVREWRKKNPKKRALQTAKEMRSPRRRDKDLWQQYRIRYTDYEAMWQKQNGLCAICGEPETATRRSKILDQSRVLSLAVDHCHDTGVIRGLLCRECNHGLGRFKDSIDNLYSAIEYLTHSREKQTAGY